MFSSKLMVEMLGALEWQTMFTLPLQDGTSQATFLHVSIQVSPCGMLGKIMTSWLAGEDGLGVQEVSGPSHLSWGKAMFSQTYSILVTFPQPWLALGVVGST